MTAVRRKRAHELLDEYLDDVETRVGPAALASESPHEARELFKRGMDFARNLLGAELRNKAAPCFSGNDPRDERRVLVESIDLLGLAWPPAGRIDAGDVRGDLWVVDVINAIQKLDVGETAPIFQASTGAGKYKWTERRYRFVAVLWANYLYLAGEEPTLALANNRVARAFNSSVTDVPYKSGRFNEGQLPKWRVHIEDVAAGIAHDDAMPMALARGGMMHASELAESWRYRDCGDAENWRQMVSRSFSQIALDAMGCGATSLDETGARFQSFMKLKSDDYTSKRKRIQRAKKLNLKDKT
jgi:hypothetical protein